MLAHDFLQPLMVQCMRRLHAADANSELTCAHRRILAGKHPWTTCGQSAVRVTDSGISGLACLLGGSRYFGRPGGASDIGSHDFGYEFRYRQRWLRSSRLDVLFLRDVSLCRAERSVPRRAWGAPNYELGPPVSPLRARSDQIVRLARIPGRTAVNFVVPCMRCTYGVILRGRMLNAGGVDLIGGAQVMDRRDSLLGERGT